MLSLTFGGHNNSCKFHSHTHFISSIPQLSHINSPNKTPLLNYLPNNNNNTPNIRVKVSSPKALNNKTNRFRHSKYNIKKSNKSYGGSLSSILRGLDSEEDVDKTLSAYTGELGAKGLTVILKEQTDWKRVLSIFKWMKAQEDYVPNLIHYNVVLRMLGRSRKFDELRICWIEMARDGVFPGDDTYGMLVDVYAKAGLGKEALLWLRHMRLRGLFPNEITMATVVWVLKELAEFDKADKFYKDWCIGKVDLDGLELGLEDDDLSGMGPRFLSTELFKAGGKMPPAAANLHTGQSERKPRLVYTYNTLIDLYAKAGRVADASLTLGEMLKSGVAPDTTTFNTMIFICGTQGDISEADALLSIMEERGISPDTWTYNIFLSLHARAGNIHRVLMWYSKIREIGLFPDEVTYIAVFHTLCERNMVSEVEDMIVDMENLGLSIDEDSLLDVIMMYVGEGLLDRAMALLEYFQSSYSLSSPTFAAIINVFVDKGLCTEAEKIFLGKKEKKDIVEYNVMIKAYGKSKLYDRALSLFRSMRSSGTWPDECTYNSLIQMLSGGDLVGPATDFLFEMQAAGFTPLCTTFTAIVESNVRLGKISNAVDVYREMLRAGVKPNEYVYGSLINGFAETGEVEEALRYFCEMKEFGISANRIILTSLIKAYKCIGCLEEAQNMYLKMKDLDDGLDVVASNCMLSLYTDLKLVSEAISIFETLRKNGQADVFSFATIIYLYRSIDMLDKAIDVAEEMQESNLLRDCASFNVLLETHAANGQLRKCGEQLHQMIIRNIEPDNKTVNTMITVIWKCSTPIETITELESAYQADKLYAKQAIMTFFFSILSMHELALDSCKKFMKADVDLGLFLYNVAIYAYGSSGEVDQALRIFMKMKRERVDPNLVTYINLVVCYGKAGMVEGLKRIYSQVDCGDIEPSASLLRALIDAYKAVDRNDLAELVKQDLRFLNDKDKPPVLPSKDFEQQPDSQSEDFEQFSDYSDPSDYSDSSRQMDTIYG